MLDRTAGALIRSFGCILSVLCLFYPSFVLSAPAAPGTCLTAEEEKLVQLINDYRVAHGLQPVPVSYSLTLVGQWHVLDLNTNRPDTGTGYQGQSCNMHSWSTRHPELWNGMCYTPDHHEAGEMWDKPRQISRGAYHGNGYEIACSTGGQVTAEAALAGWKSSSPHNDVILEQDIWENAKWPAMGVGLYRHYAVVWFGDKADAEGLATCRSSGGTPGPEKLLSPILQLLLQ